MIQQSELGLLDGFERALINDRLRLVYQPKINLSDGSLKRVEALVRWDDPEMGSVPPSRFVPLAERHGLIDEMTRWGLATAFRQCREWRDHGLECELAFNISALSLKALAFPDLVEDYCAKYDMPTSMLVLELTESATQPLVTLMDTLTRFRIKGIGLAIDDFGTGYSTLMQLRQLPFTEIKIDRFFVADACTNKDSRVIVETIIELAHKLGLSATAEGIETDEQLLLMRALECDVAQGYRVAKPLPGDRLGDWIERWRAGWSDLVSA